MHEFVIVQFLIPTPIMKFNEASPPMQILTFTTWISHQSSLLMSSHRVKNPISLDNSTESNFIKWIESKPTFKSLHVAFSISPFKFCGASESKETCGRFRTSTDCEISMGSCVASFVEIIKSSFQNFTSLSTLCKLKLKWAIIV